MSQLGQVNSQNQTAFELSPAGLARVKEELTRYEARESSIIPALYIAQKENHGWISPQIISYLSKVMDLPESKINEVFKFYTMFNQRPIGRHHVQVCATLSCHLNGATELLENICSELRVGLDQVTADGKFTVSRVECLGSCGTAPMMLIGDQYHENLSLESAMNILRGLP